MANTTTTKKDFGQTAQEVKDKAQEAASTVADKAREAAGVVADKAKDIGQSMAKTADSAAATVGGGMKSMAHTIKQNAPHEGMLGKASDAVASTVESAGRYLSEQGVTGAAEDLTNLIRRNPIPALLVGVGLGILIARATWSSNHGD